MKSALFLKLKTNVLPLIEVEENAGIATGKIQKHLSDDVSKLLLERCPLKLSRSAIKHEN